jgi:hypothetical protein
MLLRDVPFDPFQDGAAPIFQTEADEDNPHIERIGGDSLIILFDRDRYVYYSLSGDNGETWSEPSLVTRILNDQAPYDTQPHLWFDGSSWWVYFGADNENGQHSIYRSRQQIPGDWDSWGPKEPVIEPGPVEGGYGTVIGVGEPTLTAGGDLSFAVIYADLNSPDSTDVFDCDPWIMPRKDSPLPVRASARPNKVNSFIIFPNPVRDVLKVENSPRNEMEFTIYNTLGRKVAQKKASPGGAIDISTLPGGVYFICPKSNPSKAARFLKLK